MVKAVYYGIGGSLLLGVVVALFLLYNGVNDSTVSTNFETELQEKEIEQPKDFGWLKSLGEADSLSFTYPVDELNIKFSLSELTKPKRVIQIVADTVDSYEYFCIIQIFDQNRLDYSVLKQEEKFVANVSNIDDTMIEKLKKNLIYYEIDYKLNTFYTKDY